MLFICVLQPFLGSGEASNRLTGRIKMGQETLATLDGKWDQEIYIREKRTGVSGISISHSYCLVPMTCLASSQTFHNSE